MTTSERITVALRSGATTSNTPVEIVYAGTFHLADRGKVLELTPGQLEEMVSNFHQLQEAGRVPINVNHSSGASTLDQARAVGWLVGLCHVKVGSRVSLMGSPKWLPDAAEAIKAGQFKFLSAEIVFADTDTRTGQPIGCHLRGVALTNVPAIPDLAPVTLTRQQGVLPLPASGGVEPTEQEIDTYLEAVDKVEAREKCTRDQARYRVWANPSTRQLATKVNGDPHGVRTEDGAQAGADTYSQLWRAEVARVAALFPERESWYATATVAHDMPELRRVVFAPKGDVQALAHAIADFELTRGKSLDVIVQLVRQHTGVSLMA